MLGKIMNYTIIGVMLFVIGVGLIIASFIPIPAVEYVPKIKSTEELTYTPIRKVWLEDTFVVAPDRATGYCGSFPSGTTLTIYIKVTSGGNRDIDFWVMDEHDWTHFQRGESFYYYTAASRKRVTEATITWSPPSNQRICFVYDNTFSLITSKTVYSKITAEYETYTIIRTYTTTYEPEVKPYTISYLTIPGILLFIIGIGLIAGHSLGKKHKVATT